ncbi:hypothetical protein HME9302_00842 [Alteripontixanthobacter maritimus]|uniref:Flp family type IVb pilin n=1 Tax=Alteripontixanthobacter maritimus TaxID=2161824 RepID=A0A369Q597_9SPHN|nr:Flp family type IVb pilin [Alteripontixanthobacter maritimus]RDC59652.1 hypothetical protein HME9302_00842 [Alteripontixanthobacter maritimus]
MLKLILRITHDQRGTSAVEYGLILALIFLAIAGAVSALADESTEQWDGLNTKVTDASKNNFKE